jgi:hypothetical protein
MASHIVGERFIVAATLDPVETGQEFEHIPPHMTVVRWFQLQESWQPRLTGAMDRIFTDRDVYQNLVGGKARKFGEEGEVSVREILGAEIGPSFALRAFVRSMGLFRQDDVYADTFTAHVTNNPARKVRKNEKLAIPTVALIAAHSDEPMQRVVESFTLGSQEQHG